MTTCDLPPGTPAKEVGRLRGTLRRAREDIDVILRKDPAPKSWWEVLLYPHVHTLWTFRVANWCYHRDRTFAARALSMFGRWVSGIEIHPGAEIGRRFFIDHGSGVVIGETVRIGDDVMLYHQVTLGSAGWWRDNNRPPGEARHPTLEDGVIVGTNASVLGPVTIGAHSVIGAHAVVMRSVPAGSHVSAGCVLAAVSALKMPAERPPASLLNPIAFLDSQATTEKTHNEHASQVHHHQRSA